MPDLLSQRAALTENLRAMYFASFAQQLGLPTRTHRLESIKQGHSVRSRLSILDRLPMTTLLERVVKLRLELATRQEFAVKGHVES